jgi:hypothetical protein
MIADFAGRPPGFASSNNAFIAVAQKARRMSDAKLVAAEVIGFGGALAVLDWAPRTLELAFLATALGALGVWGVTDHMLESRRRAMAPLRWALSGFRFTIAAVGVAAAIAAGYAMIGRLMGVFIL